MSSSICVCSWRFLVFVTIQSLLNALPLQCIEYSACEAKVKLLVLEELLGYPLSLL